MTAVAHDLGMPTGEGDLTIEAHGMEPIPDGVRYGSVGRVFTVWFTPNLVPAAFFIGTLVTLDFLKLGFVTSLLAIITPGAKVAPSNSIQPSGSIRKQNRSCSP